MDRARQLIREIEGWSLVDGRAIRKEFRFDDFRGGLAFVNKVGRIAENQGHHPDLYLSWGRVRVEIRTHAIEGLSENDFILASGIDRI